MTVRSRQWKIKGRWTRGIEGPTIETEGHMGKRIRERTNESFDRQTGRKADEWDGPTLTMEGPK